MLTVIDYGLGNLRSICAALERLEIEYRCTSDKAQIREATGLILPGVGAFPDGMKNLQQLDLLDSLNELVLEKARPILGICLGFQLMASEGEEFGCSSGLGWVRARVVRLRQPEQSIRIPHVGWNEINLENKFESVFYEIPKNTDFYFVHSYAFLPENLDHIIAKTEYGISIVAAVRNKHIWGTQFHPEKSSRAGLKLLENFINISIC